MEHFNNFNILSGIKILTAILKIQDILLPVQHLNAIKFAVTVIFCVALDTKSSYPE